MSDAGLMYGMRNLMQQGLDPQGQQDQANLQRRQQLIQAMMQPSQNSNSGWGGLANAGSAIAGAVAQRGLQGQQQQNNLNNWARQNPTQFNIPGQQAPVAGPAGTTTNLATAPIAGSIPQGQTPVQKGFLAGLFQ